jgi:hypothetical protein
MGICIRNLLMIRPPKSPFFEKTALENGLTKGLTFVKTIVFGFLGFNHK